MLAAGPFGPFNGPWDIAVNDAFDPLRVQAEDGISMGSDSEELFEGDMVLTDHQRRQLNVTGNERNGIISTSKRWTGAVMPYTISSSFSASEKYVILKAMGDYHTKTCIQLVERTNQNNYISIVKKSGCWSYVGMTGGKQELSLGNGCVYHGTAVHELMHAAGFFHEQSRCDRDTYVRVLTENIRSGYESNFNKYDCSFVTHYNEPYDYLSVMHYGKTYFTKNGKNTLEAIDNPSRQLGQRNGFTQIDINKLNKMYQYNSVTTQATTAAPTTAPSSGCSDIYYTSYCPGWARAGYCATDNQYHSFMKFFCRGSCDSEIKSCSNCEDYIESTCATYKSRGYCGHSLNTSTGLYMAGYCKKTCGDCKCTCTCT